MGECMMPRCDNDAFKRSGLCDWHYERAYPTKVGMDYIRTHIENENARHARDMENGVYKRLAECENIEDEYIKVDKQVEILQQQRLDAVIAKVDAEIASFLTPEGVAKVFGVPPVFVRSVDDFNDGILGENWQFHGYMGKDGIQ